MKQYFDREKRFWWENIVLKTNPEKLEAAQGKLIPVLVKAIQDQQKHIEKLEQKIDKLIVKE